jgi:chemotaxis methyl-accepting protein methylase
MLFLEESSRRDRLPDIQVFASDLDSGALATAREGRYPLSIEADVWKRDSAIFHQGDRSLSREKGIA